MPVFGADASVPVNHQVLLQRIGYGLLAIVIVCALGWADAAIARMAMGWSGPLAALLRHGSVICLTCLTVYLLAAKEFTALLRHKGAQPWAGFAYLMVAAMIAAPWVAAAGWLNIGGRKIDPAMAPMLVLLVGMLGTTCAAVWQSRTDGVLRDVTATWGIIIYLGFFGSFSTGIRCGAQWPDGAGIWLLIILILVTKVSDIGAFLVGSAIGRHKLIPKVSPAKSVEGTLAGFLSSALLASLFALGAAAFVKNGGPESGLIAAMETLSAGFAKWGTISTLAGAGLIGFFVAVGAQFGDLIESCFKRDAAVKDSGYVMPRYGGMLDLIDSLITALPIGWFLLSVGWPAPNPLQ